MTKLSHISTINKDLMHKMSHTIIQNLRKSIRTDKNKIKNKKFLRKNSLIIDTLTNAKDPEIKKIIMTLKLQKFNKNKKFMIRKTHTIKIIKNDQKISTLKTKDHLPPKIPKRRSKMKIKLSSKSILMIN
jgi:hypothetical protein